MAASTADGFPASILRQSQPNRVVTRANRLHQLRLHHLGGHSALAVVDVPVEGEVDRAGRHGYRVVLRHNRRVVRSRPHSHLVQVTVQRDPRRRQTLRLWRHLSEGESTTGVNASDGRRTTCTSVLVYDTTTYTRRTDISSSQCRLSCDHVSRASTMPGLSTVVPWWISRTDELLMFVPLSLKSRQTPTLSLSAAPPVNRSYTEMASAKRAAYTATVDVDVDARICLHGKRHVACAHQTRHRLRQQHCPVDIVLLDADVNSGLQVGGVQVE